MASTIHHYIDGRSVPSTSGRSGPVYDPATGSVQAQVRFRVGRRGRRCGRRSPGGAAGVAVHGAVTAGRDHVPVPRAGRRATARNWPTSSRASTARCPATPWARSPAASRTSSSPAASRTCSRAGSPSRPRAASTSTRSASRSAWSPGSPRSTSRPWCPCGCSPTPWRAATPSSSSRPRRTPRPRCSSPTC